MLLPQVVEAFDVLADEEQRAVYDKCRDYMVSWDREAPLPACDIQEGMREAHQHLLVPARLGNLLPLIERQMLATAACFSVCAAPAGGQPRQGPACAER